MIAKFLASKLRMVAIGLLIAAIIGLWYADRSAQYRAGGNDARMEAIKRALDLVKERNKDDAEINGFTDADMCHEFGFKWVPNVGCIN